MKSFIKIFTLSLLITAPIFAMDQQNGQAERKTQAQLDAQRYLGEQDSKNRSAQTNASAADAAIAKQLQKEEDERMAGDHKKDLERIAQEDEVATDYITCVHTGAPCDLPKEELINKLPAGALCDLPKERIINELPTACVNSIVEFCCGYPAKLKFIARNMHKLIPAVISWDYPWAWTLFNEIDIVQKNGLKTEMRKLNAKFSHDREVVRPSERAAYKKEPNAFVAYRLDKAPVFKVCLRKFKLLESLSIDQLNCLVQLYDEQDHIRKNCPGSNNMQQIDVARKLSQGQIDLYNSLPESIRNCLESNYGNRTVIGGDGTSLPHQMAVVVLTPRTFTELDNFFLDPQDQGQENQDQEQNQNNGETQ